MSRKQLYLFSELPIDCVFAFETPENTTTYKKVNETQAVSNHSPIPRTVSPSILVFPLYPFCLLTDVTQLDQADQEAHLVSGDTDLGNWMHEGESW